MSKYTELQIKKVIENNKPSKFSLLVQIKGEFAATNWLTISHATAKVLAKLLN